MSRSTRRQFLATTGAGAAFSILPGGLLRGDTVKLNDKLNIAFIGMGGQIQGHVEGAIREGHRIAAFCDVDEGQIERSLKRHGEPTSKAKRYAHFRDLLEKEKDINAVVIATPDHWHAPICRLAMEAGKHVYCEKPLTHTVAEARGLRELARKSQVVTQTGNQGSASSNLRRSMELIEADVFGAIREVHVWHCEHGWPSGVTRPEGADPVPEGLNWDFWLGAAPVRPFKNGIYHPVSWRGWYDFGNGSLGDFCCHAFNLPVRALHLDYPTKIEITGQGLGLESFARSCTIRYHFPPNGERDYAVSLNFYTGGDLPPEGVTDSAVKTFGEVPRVGCILVGDKGRLSAGLWNSECYLNMKGEEKYLGADKHEASKNIPQSLPRVEGHLNEWFDACAGKTKTFADFDFGGHLTEIGLAGIIALRLQKNIEWDGPNMRAKGLPEADILIAKENRTKWL